MDFVYFTRDLERELAAAQKQLADQANVTEWERRYDEEVLKNVQLRGEAKQAREHGKSVSDVLQSRHEKAVADLRRELQESHAREVAYHEALVLYHNALDEGTENCSSMMLEECQAMAEAALSTPPPKVVPMEDVKPMVDAIKPLIEDLRDRESDERCGTCGEPYPETLDRAEAADKALATFTAKHGGIEQ